MHNVCHYMYIHVIFYNSQKSSIKTTCNVQANAKLMYDGNIMEFYVNVLWLLPIVYHYNLFMLKQCNVKTWHLSQMASDCVRLFSTTYAPIYFIIESY